MPQTREHLDILELLGILKGLVVITKIDLVDEEWLEMVVEEVKGELQGDVPGGCSPAPCFFCYESRDSGAEKGYCRYGRFPCSQGC